ncbi:MAG TPA: hypothetical protein PKA64_26315 [Myxococcota bacterium]|nr:hypothetical protein [Myxococcota bacterium]
MDVAAHVARILEAGAAADPDTIGPETPLTSIDGWDSMGVVFFLGEVAAHWPSVHLSSDEVASCRTVADLARLIER